MRFRDHRNWWLKKQRTSSSTVVLTEDPADFRPNFDPHYEFLRLVTTTLSRSTVDHWRKSSVIASGMIDQCGPPCSCLRFRLPMIPLGCQYLVPRAIPGYPNLDPRVIRVIHKSIKGSIKGSIVRHSKNAIFGPVKKHQKLETQTS